MAIESVTHQQLLNPEIKISLPVIGVELPVFGFFAAAPVVLTLLHLYFLVHVIHFAHELQLARLERGVTTSNGKKLDQSNEKWKSLVHGSMFPVVFLNPKELSRVTLNFMNIIVYLSFFWLVPFVLLRTQWQFLSYHSFALTALHKFLVIFSVFLSLAHWFPINWMTKHRDRIWSWREFIAERLSPIFKAMAILAREWKALRDGSRLQLFTIKKFLGLFNSYVSRVKAWFLDLKGIVEEFRNSLKFISSTGKGLVSIFDRVINICKRLIQIVVVNFFNLGFSYLIIITSFSLLTIPETSVENKRCFKLYESPIQYSYLVAKVIFNPTLNKSEDETDGNSSDQNLSTWFNRLDWVKQWNYEF